MKTKITELKNEDTKRGLILETAKELCAGDSNGIAYLNAEFSDWVEVIIDAESITVFENVVRVQGNIQKMKYWYDEERKRNVSDWGTGFEFDLKNYTHDDEYIYDVDGKWDFVVNIIDGAVILVEECATEA